MGFCKSIVRIPRSSQFIVMSFSRVSSASHFALVYDRKASTFLSSFYWFLSIFSIYRLGLDYFRRAPSRLGHVLQTECLGSKSRRYANSMMRSVVTYALSAYV